MTNDGKMNNLKRKICNILDNTKNCTFKSHIREFNFQTNEINVKYYHKLIMLAMNNF